MDNIILIGLSIGSAVVIKLASLYPKLRGVITINAFTSIKAVAKNLVGGLIAKFVPDIFKSIDYVDKIRCPILYIHGSDDSLIPYQHSQELFNAAKSRKRFTIIPNMTHNRLFIDLILEAIDVFSRTEMDLTAYLENEKYKSPSFQEDIQKIRASSSVSFIHLNENSQDDVNTNRFIELEPIKTYNEKLRSDSLLCD